MAKSTPLPLRAAALLLPLVCLAPTEMQAATVARLDEKNWDTHAPEGKEVDAIYGDWVLRNDKVVIVVANPIQGRNANMTTHKVGGAVIDMTDLALPNDQLTAFYPAPQGYEFRGASHRTERDGTAVLTVGNQRASGQPRVEVEYRLSDGDSFLRVRTRVSNTTRQQLTVNLRDEMRADTVFTEETDEMGRLAWVYDPWFRQAYGVLVEAENLTVTIADAEKDGKRAPFGFQYQRDGSDEVILRPGAKLEFERLLLSGRDTLTLRETAAKRQHTPLRPTLLAVRDVNGAVAAARVQVRIDGHSYGSAYTDARGRVETVLPHAGIEFKVESLGRTSQNLSAEPGATPVSLPVEMDQPGYVVASITDGEGKPIPCKVQFIGKGGTPSPYFFHEAGENRVENLYYSHDGKFVQPLAPETYNVIVSYGPKYNAHFAEIKVQRGGQVPLKAKLERVVDTRGWISAELHSHSSPSGDNVASQRGRVLNLLAEQIEFAPCTEHNRIDSYEPHLKALEAEQLMATCSGMELTRSPGSRGHQNAFPLVHKPRTQDGGAPGTDPDPAKQVKRLFYWDDESEKIIQANHPNIVELFFDQDLDGKGDDAHRTMLPYLDVIEVHPPHRILEPARVKGGKNTGGNRIHSWLQLLNQGVWVPGVVNTDAHWNNHGSGGLRNYIHSPVDDPAKADIADFVRSLRKGHVVMSNGPFMEAIVDAPASRNRGISGDTVSAPDGSIRLHLRVQCSNWLDIDRVQVMVNGRSPAKWNFTRKTHPDWFKDGVIKFQRTIPMNLERDAHLIVVAIGEHKTVGPIMGDRRGKANPIAISNPIFIDVDGGGFAANGDTLAGPLPLKKR